jgi:hypothetical protein
VFAPTGKKIPFRTFRIETLFDGVERGRDATFIGVGLTKSVDAEFGWDTFQLREGKFVLNTSYNLVDPVVNFGPGVSFGVQDLFANTERGRVFFGALTWRMGLDGDLNYDTPMEITTGYVVGDRNGLVLGVMIPFARFFRGVAEYDAHEAIAGLDLRPIPEASIRWLHRRGQSFWSLSWTRRF